MRLEDYLRLHAERQPEKTAVVCGDEQYSYARLYRCVREHAATLTAAPGTAIVFRATQSINFLIDYLGSHEAGCVAVPLESDTPDTLFREIEDSLSGRTLPEGTADILFTTGTTGRSKGVVISHRAILANAENLIAAQQFSPELTFVIAGPLNHIGSLSKIFPTLLVGATLHITTGLKDMATFLQVIEDCPTPKAATFLVPAHIRLLMALGGERLAQSKEKIDFIETGAAPIAQSDMEQLARLLPHSRLYNTYASTETGIIATHDWSAETHCTAGCLGHTMKHSTLRISDDGLIVCGGATLMTGYWNDEEATRQILHGGEIYTQDRGSIDEKGRLHLSGRDGDTLNIGGYKINPTEVEEATLTIGGIKDCICIAAPHPLLGQTLKLLIVADTEQHPTPREIALSLKKRLEGYKIPQLFEYVTHIERTYNGKLNRKAYR